MQSEANKAHVAVMLQVVRKYGHALEGTPVTCPLIAPLWGATAPARFFRWHCPGTNVGSDGGNHEYAAHPTVSMQAVQQAPEVFV